MRTTLAVVFGSLIALLMIVAPFNYKRWHDHEYRNFHVVEEGILYRSGQLPLPRLQKIVGTYGIRTVISLRDSDKPTDQDEEVWVKAKGYNFVRIPQRSWWPDANGIVPADESVKTFRAVMDDTANYPVLVHCFAGIHRTGTMCAIFRMDYQGWSNEQAMNEMRVMGYTVLDEHQDIHAYVSGYRPTQSERLVPGLQTGFKKNPLP